MNGAFQTSEPKHLIDFLPAIYQEGHDPDQPSFLAHFLKAFELVLFGNPDPLHDSGRASSKSAPGLEQEILALPSLLDPLHTREEFLPWLAGWAALDFHPDLDEANRRKLLSHIVSLYGIRGTRRYLEELLTLTLDSFVAISDVEIAGLQIGSHASIGLDTFVGGGPAHFFSVWLIMPKLDERQRNREISIARSVLDQAKPAHTSYDLVLTSPQMQIGIHSSVGLDTVVAPAF